MVMFLIVKRSAAGCDHVENLGENQTVDDVAANFDFFDELLSRWLSCSERFMRSPVNLRESECKELSPENSTLFVGSTNREVWRFGTGDRPPSQPIRIDLY